VQSGLAVTPDWIAEHFLAVHLLDTREKPREHIPSAVHLPLSTIEAMLSGVETECHLVLIAESDDAAMRAVDVVRGLGFARVEYLEGGMNRWLEEGRPSQAGRPPSPTPQHRQRRRSARGES